MRSSEHAAESRRQSGPDVLESVNTKCWCSFGRQQLGHLVVGQSTVDRTCGDLENLIPGDEAKSAFGRDYQAVEQVELWYLQHVLNGAEAPAGRALHGSADRQGEVRDRMLAAHDDHSR